MTRPNTSTVLICIGLFFVFVLLKFPFRNLKGYLFNKIYSQTRILLVAEDIYPSLLGWPGVGITNVDVILPVANQELELYCKKLIFRVGIGGLFPPIPSISLTLRSLKKGGDLFLRYRNKKTITDVLVDASNINLDQLMSGWLSQPLNGTISGVATLSIDQANFSQSMGDIDLHAEKLKLPTQNLQGFILPELNIGSLWAKMIMKNGVVEFSNLQIGDRSSDLSGSVNGEIRLGSEPTSSQLNITLRFQLSERYRKLAEVQSLISFLEGSFKSSRGGYAMRWSSRLADMRMNVFPQAITD